MKKKILFVFSDQHRWCDLGCYGNPDVISPNLDRFTEEGLLFSCCISNSPVCVPACSSLLPWTDMLRRFGLVEVWNRSQRHFGFPELD